MTAKKIDRRTLLRGAGTAVALPILEAMLPRSILAASAKPTAPLRMGFFFLPNGMQMNHWTPKKEGPLEELPKTLKPLAPLKDQVMILTGLMQDNASAKGDGAGDHARSAACFLTGAHPVKTAGGNIRVGVSVDQVAASRIGRFTQFPSLELGCEQGSQVGSCDSGYSCAYSSNISWRSPSQPMTKEVNPRSVFERFFGSGEAAEKDKARAKRQAYDKSVLDFVREDAARLQRSLGVADQRKLEEYLTAVREVELRIDRGEKLSADQFPEVKRPEGVPKAFKDHLRVMYDLLALAFRADLTRVSTMMLANEGSNRGYPFLGVPEGHHDLSHHGNDAKKREKIQKIDEFHIEQFAYFLERLRSTPEGDGTLLDHCMLLYGSGIGDGNRHNHDDLPIMLCGKANGQLKPGRHLRVNATPLNNLFLSMLDRMVVPCPSLGDSTGRLAGLA